MLFKELQILKDTLEPYTSLVLGPYFNTGLLLVFGLIFALILYIIPNKYKFKFVLAGSILFALLSSTLANLIIFFAIVLILYFCSNYNFKFSNIIFWITEAIMLISNMIIYRIFGYHSSFYSFVAYYTMYRTIHYYVDLNQGSMQKLKLIDYLAYLFYFPSFSHGPVERVENLHPGQVKKENVLFGFKRIVIGLVKYALLVYVLSRVEEVPFSFSNFWQWLVLTAYVGAIKLYVLLSGDIDIVIGVSALMGFRVSENFPKFPYIQPTLTKFWQNWQATIVNWLTAYVYFPLCRNRKHVYAKTMIIIMIIGWAHLFYYFKDFPAIEYIMYYTLWGVFLGGTLALSKIWGKKKAESKQIWQQKYPAIAKIIYANNYLTKAIRIFITFNIIAIGWLSPLYILLKQLI